jgi:cell division control protein 6
LGFDKEKVQLIEDGAFLSGDSAAGELLGRKDELERLRASLTPVLRSQRPVNVWLWGPPGSGKTTLARRAVHELNSTPTRAGIYVNCWQHRSLYSVLQAIIDELKILRAEAQDTHFKFERIRQALRGRPTVIILDEIDRPMPKQRDEIIYGLLSLPKTGLICIANSTQPLAVMDERVRSRLSPVVIGMSAYAQNEIQAILEDRARQALAPGSWSPAALTEIARVVRGDARLAIQTLRQAAAATEQAGRHRIDRRVVSQLMSPWHDIRQEQRLAGLTDDERAIVQLAARRAPIGTTKLRHLYAAHCRDTGQQAVARRTFSKYVSRLAAAGILDIASRPSALGGRIVRAAGRQRH